MRLKCNVCGKRFMPDVRRVYQVVETLSVTEMLATAPKTYDVIDCPRCGCQKRLNVRMSMAKVVTEDDD